MKHKKIIIAAGIVSLFLILAGAFYFLGLFRSTPLLESPYDIPIRFSLSVPSASNFRQGPNQCGPYSAAMLLSAVQSAAVHPAQLAKQLPWKLPRGYTHPRALESLIHQQGVQVRSYDAGPLTNEQKIQFLHQQLASGHPVILLTLMYGYQHYITLLGYDTSGEEFFVYDPVFTRGNAGMTLDANGGLPGNRNIGNANLLLDWSHGGIAGFYTWYMLSAS